jgi:hypothetical protein
VQALHLEENTPSERLSGGACIGLAGRGQCGAASTTEPKTAGRECGQLPWLNFLFAVAKPHVATSHVDCGHIVMVPRFMLLAPSAYIGMACVWSNHGKLYDFAYPIYGKYTIAV